MVCCPSHQCAISFAEAEVRRLAAGARHACYALLSFFTAKCLPVQNACYLIAAFDVITISVAPSQDWRLIHVRVADLSNGDSVDLDDLVTGHPSLVHQPFSQPI